MNPMATVINQKMLWGCINYNKNYTVTRNKFNSQMYNIFLEKNHKTSLIYIKEDSNRYFNNVISPQTDL